MSGADRKKALITGASRGIGRSVASALASSGFDLYLTCRNNRELLDSLAEELRRSYGIQCYCYAFSICDEDKVSEMFRDIPYLDVLVNNAGISYVGLLTDMTYQQWREVIDINLSACFLTCRHAVPEMVRRRRGKIINISSVWGSTGASMEVAYSASKGGVNAFTRALAKELAPSNIQVNAAAFGLIDTDMNQHFSAEELDALKEEIPADRAGTCEEAAALLLQLAHSPDYLTGQIITMDGGWT